MAKLIHSSIGSLDAYVAEQEGDFDWAEPDEDVHKLVNELQRPVGTFLLGRRLYEVLIAWDLRLELELLDERRFGNGTIFLRYRTRP